MSSTAEPDGSEDVNDFLKRIRELGDKRDREDEDRTKRLEEEILQGRKERQARRAERARSLSPAKDSPSNTPQSIRSSGIETPTRDKMATPPRNAQPFSAPSPRDVAVNEALWRLNGDMSPSQENVDPKISTASKGFAEPSKSFTGSSKPSPSSAMAPSRAATLSWQRRPTSQSSDTPRSRPLSAVASENNANKSPRANPEPANPVEADLSRSQIAQSLSSKDPSWFKQTSDRGVSSPAYRRSGDKTTPSDMFAGGSMRLPGMSRESVAEPKSSPPSESTRSTSPSRSSSVRGGSSQAIPPSSNTSVSALSSRDGRSPFPTSSYHVLDPPTSDTASSTNADPQDQSNLGRTMAMSPSQGRISPERMERPSSPTKGLGGFVQSAMLKRSDSVNKRWSSQSNTGLSRGNSMVSHRSGYGSSSGGLAGSATPLSPSKLEARPSSLSRDTSPALDSRPSSSRSNATITQEEDTRNTARAPGMASSVAEGAPDRGRSQDTATENPYGDAATTTAARADITSPGSPSKGLDQRRWSPSKASWLESALNKGPESPKPRAPPPQQPSWMADITKAKKERASVDLNRSGGFKQVDTGGLMRAPAPGASTIPNKPVTISSTSKSDVGPSSQSSSAIAQKEKVMTKSPPTRPKSTQLLSQISQPTTKSSQEDRLPSPPADQQKGSVITSQEPRDRSSSGRGQATHAGENVSPKTPNAKPETPPKKDFRSNLKPRNLGATNKPQEEPEFKNVFGKLKHTQTKNFVAPDELKSNILRGKAGLNATGGPKKDERRDELRESLIKQKEAMKSKTAGKPEQGISRAPSGSIVSRSQDQPTPEAISRQRTLSRSQSNTVIENNPDPEFPRVQARRKTTEEEPKPHPAPLQNIAPIRLKGQNAAGSTSLANKFNPGLAAMLARGSQPSAPAKNVAKESDYGSSKDVPDETREKGEPGTVSGGKLTHMTKARARGPKRRLPASVKGDLHGSPDVSWEDSKAGIGTAQAETELQPEIPKERVKLDDSPKQPSAKPQTKSRVASPLTEEKPSSAARTPQAMPEVPPKSPQLAKRSTPKSEMEQSPSLPSTSYQPSPQMSLSSHLKSEPFLPDFPNKNVQSSLASSLEDDDTGVNSKFSVKNASTMWSQSSEPPSSELRSPKSPIKLPTRGDEEAAMINAGLRSSSKSNNEPVGLGLQHVSSKSRGQEQLDRNLPSPPLRSPSSLPQVDLPSTATSQEPGRSISSGLHHAGGTSQDTGSPIPHTSEAFRILADFFADEPRSMPRVDVDTQTVLSSKFDEDINIKTLRKQIWELSGDGKKLPVPPHQEHILFENSMYICTHVFGAADGKRTTEVYFWIGDNVSGASIEDAQLFARKIAREDSGKLITFKQGRETSRFFQALGGIVIIRRGASSRANSQNSFMLCGRRHMGQIAFDEVDLSPHSLCSAFPYIVSSKSGKLFVWKGKGSGADELGCARLIAMDLGLTGDVEEIDEGHEPTSFFDILGPAADATSLKSSESWGLKPRYDNYGVRLFRVVHGTKPTVLHSTLSTHAKESKAYRSPARFRRSFHFASRT
ncbi:MAG: hypothetical protein M1837_005368 [Sclerophora amabilis]|nr:MAG: hypothetical protein M1837_005368 [Sclerophora amabilis]